MYMTDDIFSQTFGVDNSNLQKYGAHWLAQQI
jgi:hypothetical protein